MPNPKNNKRKAHRQGGGTTLQQKPRTKTTGEQQPKGKQTRNRYTFEEKLFVLNRIKPDRSNKSEIANEFGIQTATMNLWLRHQEDIQNQNQHDTKKAASNSPLWRLHAGLNQFYQEHLHNERHNNNNNNRHGNDHNNNQHNDDDCNSKKLFKMTGTVWARQARRIKDQLLFQNLQTPFLTQRELEAYHNFQGSDSWGRKFLALRKNSTTTGTTAKRNSCSRDTADEHPADSPVDAAAADDDDTQDDDDDDDNANMIQQHLDELAQDFSILTSRLETTLQQFHAKQEAKVKRKEARTKRQLLAAMAAASSQPSQSNHSNAASL